MLKRNWAVFVFRCLFPSICWGGSPFQVFCLECCQDTGTSSRQYKLSRYRSLFDAWFYVWKRGYLASPDDVIRCKMKKHGCDDMLKLRIYLVTWTNWYMYVKKLMWNQQVLKSSESSKYTKLLLFRIPLPLFHLKEIQV